MTGYDPQAYGKALAETYDELYGDDAALETDAAVELITRLALERAPHRFLELGIGTGRLALGVLDGGVAVAGIDATEAMVRQLRRKPGGEQVETVIGDYTTATVDGTFSVVALVFNNVFDPRGRSAQMDLFRNAARHLAPGGCFVVEAFVLSDAQRSGEWMVTPRFVAAEHVELQLARYDIASNRIERTLVHLREGGVSLAQVRDTYASPGELDVMADVCGFELAERRASWAGATFTASSRRHVSVYRLR